MNYKAEIVKTITALSGKYPVAVIFSDWVECYALAIRNSTQLIHDSLWNKREEQYMNIVKKYTSQELEKFLHMNTLLAKALDEDIRDMLGEVYMESGCGSAAAGQFFTPFHISKLTAQLSLKTIPEGAIIINEPSCGGGGMIIAVAAVLAEKGINFQRRMKVVAQDLDWRSVYMTYVQLSLLGIDAEVVQGDTLSNPYSPKNYPKECIFRTPKRMLGGRHEKYINRFKQLSL